MSRLLLKLATASTVGILLSSSPVTAQHPRAAKGEVLPPAPKVARVKIIYGPTLEIAHDDVAILRWITNNPGGSDDHFAVAEYGTDPKHLSQTAKSQIRLNRAQPETIFRVRISGLTPRTTYYYRVTSEESNGASDRVQSRVKKFTMPAMGQRIVYTVKDRGRLGPLMQFPTPAPQAQK